MSNTIASKPIWDLPTRIFHWLLVLLVVLQYGTGKFGWLDMQWHFWFGYALLTLLLFRIVWGFIGSDTARFSRFITGPKRVIAYLRNWSATPMSRFQGHNPAGGWAALLILFVLLVQAVSGLATSDDMEWYGPLCHRVADRWIELGTWLHHRLEPITLLLIALHVIAIALYWLLKRENLIAGMLHGARRIEVAAPRHVSPLRALIVFALVAALVSGFLWSLE